MTEPFERPALAGWRPLSPPGQQVRRLTAISGRDYDLMLCLPNGPAPEGGFSTVVVLDGESHFQLVASAVTALGRRTAKTGVPPLAVLGIASVGAGPDSVRRAFDYTPTVQPEPPAKAPHEGGGAAEFLDLIADVALPTAAAEAPLALSRVGLFSHSLGALFGLYALSRRPELFRAWALVSPSLWWAPDLAGRAVASAKGRDLTIHLAWGERETSPPGVDRAMGPRAAALLADFIAALPEGAVSGGELAGEDHGSAPFAACAAALRAMASALSPTDDRPMR